MDVRVGLFCREYRTLCGRHRGFVWEGQGFFTGAAIADRCPVVFRENFHSIVEKNTLTESL